MKKYFKLKTAFEPEILGVNNGIFQAELDENNPITKQLKDFFFSNRYWQEQKYVPDFEVKNCTATLLKRAKLTDFLQFSPNLMTCPFMINDKVLSVFEKFKIQQNYTYPVQLKNFKGRGIEEQYHIFCSPFLGYEVIDFSKSVFYRPQGIHIKQYLNCSNEDEFKLLPTMTDVEKIAFNSSFDSTLDLFKARLGGMYVSEALKDAIEILGFTGVHVLEDYEPEIIIT